MNGSRCWVETYCAKPWFMEPLFRNYSAQFTFNQVSGPHRQDAFKWSSKPAGSRMNGKIWASVYSTHPANSDGVNGGLFRKLTARVTHFTLLPKQAIKRLICIQTNNQMSLPKKNFFIRNSLFIFQQKRTVSSSAAIESRVAVQTRHRHLLRWDDLSVSVRRDKARQGKAGQVVWCLLCLSKLWMSSFLKVWWLWKISTLFVVLRTG